MTNEQRLKNAVNEALSDLECIEVHCWAFTRQAMNIGTCFCSSCKTWRNLQAALDCYEDEASAP